MTVSDTGVARGRARIGSKIGLHARPAALVAQAVAASGATVRIGRTEGAGVDARSPLMLISLGAKHGEEVVVEAEGADAERALAQVVAVLETDHDDA